jgi:hypothetical protein
LHVAEDKASPESCCSEAAGQRGAAALLQKPIVNCCRLRRQQLFDAG